MLSRSICRHIWALGLVSTMAMLGPEPAAATIYVGGDSLGVGVHLVSHAPSVARDSVRITSAVPVDQVLQVPKGSTLFLSLGTNDAVGGVTKVQKNVDAILAAAADRNIRVVWLGPPCVFKAWDDSAKALDGVLAGLLAQQRVTYVSMREGGLCSRSLRAGDGVHFTMKGYRMMWDRAIAASGEADSAPVQPPQATARKARQVAELSAPVPMPEPGFRTGGPTYEAPAIVPAPLPAFRRPAF